MNIKTAVWVVCWVCCVWPSAQAWAEPSVEACKAIENAAPNDFEATAACYAHLTANNSPEHVEFKLWMHQHLSALERHGDLDMLHQAAKRYLRDAKRLDPKDVEMLHGIDVHVRFKACTTLFATDSEDAAPCFVALVDLYPRHKIADEALYNAGIAFERVKRYESAAFILERLVNAYPTSALAAEALLRLAQTHLLLGDFEMVLKRYARYCSQFPTHKDAKQILWDYIVLLQMMGNDHEVVRASEAYMFRYSKTSPTEAARLAFHIGHMYETNDQPDKAVQAYATYLKRWSKTGPPELTLRSYNALGQRSWKQKSYKKARKAFEKALTSHMKSSAQEETTRWAAESQFMLTELARLRYEAVALVWKSKTPAKRLETLSNMLTEKFKLLKETETQYQKVFELKNPTWSIAACYRIGELYDSAVQALYDIEIPTSPYDADAWKGDIETFASPVEERAIAMYTQCMEKAKALHMNNVWVQKTRGRLEMLRSETWKSIGIQPPARYAPRGYTSIGWTNDPDPFLVERALKGAASP